MMSTLKSHELFYMDNRPDGSVAIENRSYAFIKTTLFGFKGWDKYILTEDDVLRDFLEYLIISHCKPSFYQTKIIYVGGGSNTTDLMKRNMVEGFLTSDPKNVITVLDGDQKTLSHSKQSNVFCIPIKSVENELLSRCLTGYFWNLRDLKGLIYDFDRLSDFLNGNLPRTRNDARVIFYNLILRFKRSMFLRRKLSVAKAEPAKERDFNNAGKRLYIHLTKKKIFTKHDIFEFIIKINSRSMRQFIRDIEKFTCLEIPNYDNDGGSPDTALSRIPLAPGLAQ